MINKIIRNYLIKQTAGRADDGIMITLRDPQKVELLENIMADLLMRNGIDPRTIKSEAQLKGFLNQIEAMTKQSATTSGIKNTQSAKVFDLEGNKLDPNKPIMGGTQEGMFDNIFNKMQNERKGLKAIDDDLPPPGSRGGPDDIAAPIQSAEESLKDMTEAEIKKKIEESNKKGIANIKKKLDDDPEKKADGGRIGLKEGSGMTRRTFLKLLTGLAAVPVIGKVLKPLKVGKTVTKVPIIKTGDVPGKPEWFDQLVNKVILEGDDVTKKFATQERQVVHMKKIDDDTSVTVTQDLNDGSIMVDVDDPIRNVMGETGDDTSVQMMLKKGQADETTKGTPADEFSFTEADMRNYMDGPDDYTTEFVENTVNKMSDLTSDLSKIESYATGKKLTMKQIVDSKKRRDMVELAERNPAEYAAGRGPDGPDFPEPDDFASGGIARMLGE
jgi:hypothetical protein